jgi:hypothetical protein
MASLLLTGCIREDGTNHATFEQDAKHVKKILNGKVGLEKMADNVSDYNDPTDTEITDFGDKKITHTLRQMIVPGKLWRGYNRCYNCELPDMKMPVAIKFREDGTMMFYQVDSNGEAYNPFDTKFTTVAVLGNGDPDELSDAEKYMKEKEKNLKEGDVLSTKTDLDGNILGKDGNIIARNDKNAPADDKNGNTIKTLYDFKKALDKNNLISSGKATLLNKQHLSVKTNIDDLGSPGQLLRITTVGRPEADLIFELQ